MPSENILTTFTTAANLAGADALKASLFGLNAETVALAGVMFAVFEVGKAGLDNLKKQETATGLLTQAYATQKDTLAAHKDEIQRFLDINSRFISDQYDTQEAMAGIIRAGYNTKDALGILGDALDLAAIKHIPVTDAEKTLVLAMAGNKRAVKDLLGDTVAFDKIQNDKTLPTAEKHRRILKLIEDRINGGRDALDQTAQKQNDLNKAWQDFTVRTGPGVQGMLLKILEAATTLYGILDLTVQALDKIGGHHNAAYDLFHPPTTSGTGGAGAGRALAPGPGSKTAAVELHIHGGVFMDNGPTLDALANTLIRHARFRPGT